MADRLEKPTWDGYVALFSNQKIYAQHCNYFLAQQTDGNLVVYGPGNVARWATNRTIGWTDFLAFQIDGNAVEYSASGHAEWASNTPYGLGYYFVMQADGNLVMYDAFWGSHWASNSVGPVFTNNNCAGKQSSYTNVFNDVHYYGGDFTSFDTYPVGQIWCANACASNPSCTNWSHQYWTCWLKSGGVSSAHEPGNDWTSGAVVRLNPIP
jgi:hypothetical protein